MVKCLPIMQETRVQSLCWEDSPEEGNDNLLQYPCLENAMDRGAWRAIVHGVTKSQTRLSDFQSHKLRSDSARIETQVSHTPSSLMFSLNHALCLSTDSP